MKNNIYTKDKTESQHIWVLQKAHALSHFQNYENAQSLVCNGCWSVNILVAAETVVSRKKGPSNIPPKLWLYVCLWKIGERVLDQESFIALFHSHLYKFIDIYILEGGMNSSERMLTVRGGCLSKKKKLALGGTDGEVLSWLGKEFLNLLISIFWRVGWLLQRECS